MNPIEDEKEVQVNPVPKRRGCLGWLGRAALGVLVFLVILVVAGAIYQATASASDARKYPPPGQVYEVGGTKLHLYCTGEGSPTVILEAGAGSPSLTWFPVQEKITELTRVCSYDRPGFGWSEPASEPLSSEQVAANLHGLLEAAGVPGPYVLVGHSAGGVYARAFAHQYPSEVLGMVLVDSSHESQNARFPTRFQEYSARQNAMVRLCKVISPIGAIRLAKLYHTMIPENITTSDWGAAAMSTMYRTSYCDSSYDEIVAITEAFSQPGGPASLGDMPLIVLSAGGTFKEMPEAIVKAVGQDTLDQMEQVSQEMQRELAGLSSQGEQVIAEQSTHYIQWDQPKLVIEAIREMVEQAQSK
jgi:pimeloyl-ACP methyl ester carboxylesterase